MPFPQEDRRRKEEGEGAKEEGEIDLTLFRDARYDHGVDDDDDDDDDDYNDDNYDEDDEEEEIEHGDDSFDFELWDLMEERNKEKRKELMKLLRCALSDMPENGRPYEDERWDPVREIFRDESLDVWVCYPNLYDTDYENLFQREDLLLLEIFRKRPPKDVVTLIIKRWPTHEDDYNPFDTVFFATLSWMRGFRSMHVHDAKDHGGDEMALLRHEKVFDDVEWEAIRCIYSDDHRDLLSKFLPQSEYQLDMLYLRPPEDVLQTLLERWIDDPRFLINENDDEGLTMLHHYVKCGAPHRMIERIIERDGSLVAVKSLDGKYPLYFACEFASKYGLDRNSRRVIACLKRAGEERGDAFVDPVLATIPYDNITDDVLMGTILDDPLDKTIGKHANLETGSTPVKTAILKECRSGAVVSFLLRGERFTLKGMSPLMLNRLAENASKSRELQEVINEQTCQRMPTALIILEGTVQVALVMTFVEAAENFFLDRPDDKANRALLFIGAYLVLREVLELLYYTVEYFANFWNWFDIVRVSLVVMSAIFLNWADSIAIATENVRDVLLLTGGFVVGGLVIFLRSTFLPFAEFVGGLLVILKTLFPFLVVSILMVFMFSFMYFANGFDSESCHPDYKPTTSVYSTGFCSLGDSIVTTAHYFYSGPDQTPTWWLDLIYGLGIVVILLNVVIAIVSDAWGDAKRRVGPVFWGYRINILASVESLSTLPPLIRSWIRSLSLCPGAAEKNWRALSSCLHPNIAVDMNGGGGGDDDDDDDERPGTMVGWQRAMRRLVDEFVKAAEMLEDDTRPFNVEDLEEIHVSAVYRPVLSCGRWIRDEKHAIMKKRKELFIQQKQQWKESKQRWGGGVKETIRMRSRDGTDSEKSKWRRNNKHNNSVHSGRTDHKKQQRWSSQDSSIGQWRMSQVLHDGSASSSSNHNDQNLRTLKASHQNLRTLKASHQNLRDLKASHQNLRDLKASHQNLRALKASQPHSKLKASHPPSRLHARGLGAEIQKGDSAMDRASLLETGELFPEVSDPSYVEFAELEGLLWELELLIYRIQASVSLRLDGGREDKSRLCWHRFFAYIDSLGDISLRDKVNWEEEPYDAQVRDAEDYYGWISGKHPERACKLSVENREKLLNMGSYEANLKWSHKYWSTGGSSSSSSSSVGGEVVPVKTRCRVLADMIVYFVFFIVGTVTLGIFWPKSIRRLVFSVQTEDKRAFLEEDLQRTMEKVESGTAAATSGPDASGEKRLKLIETKLRRLEQKLDAVLEVVANL